MNDSFDSFDNPFSSFPLNDRIDGMEAMEIHENHENHENQPPEKGKFFEIGFLTSNYENVKKNLEKIELEAEQLKNGLEVRRTMAGCLSERLKRINEPNQGRPLPISCNVQANWLHNGHIFLEETVKNSSGCSFIDWSLVTTMRPMSYRKVPSQPSLANETTSIELGKLMDGEEFRGHLALASTSTSLPLLIQPQMLRKFDLGDGNLSVYRIDLDAQLVTLWDLATPFDQQKGDEFLDRPIHSTTLTLPPALVNLLCGCPKDLKVGHLLRSLLPKAYRERIQLEQNEMTIIVSFSNIEKHLFKISVNRQSRREPFTLRIACRDGRGRAALIADFQARLLLSAHSFVKRPHSSLQVIDNTGSLDEEFDRICKNFST